ncbi:MAG: arsenate reductase ArsC [Alphaproteobacteria bacterium]|nr:arsenate reductase ArsC [Alphaproteobacteria bacterium]
MTDPPPTEQPRSVLFACAHNAVRSPMAEGMLKYLLGKRIYVDSCGVMPAERDPFMVAAMAELGIELGRHKAKSFDELEDGSFDLIVTLSPEAHHKAVEMTRTMACAVEYWPTLDPTHAEGSRDVRLDAYRTVRDQLFARIKRRFGITGGPTV